jgi:hypothetical protein
LKSEFSEEMMQNSEERDETQIGVSGSVKSWRGSIGPLSRNPVQRTANPVCVEVRWNHVISMSIRDKYSPGAIEKLACLPDQPIPEIRLLIMLKLPNWGLEDIAFHQSETRYQAGALNLPRNVFVSLSVIERLVFVGV